MTERTVTIPRDAPFFAGHFPGAPVLPGVVQLGLVLEALGRPRLVRVVHFRLRETVGPGDVLTIRTEGDACVRFAVERDGRVVARGLLEVA